MRIAVHGIRPALVVLLLGLTVWLAGCGARPGVPIEQVELGEHVVELPGRVDELGIEPNEIYRVRAAVSLPPSMHGEPVDLSIPLLEAAVSLEVDGQAIPGNGPPTGYREPGPHRFRIPATATADGHLELWLDIDHRWAKSGWISTTPQIVPAGARDPPAEATQWLNVFSAWLAMGVLFQVGATCLLVYVLDRRHKPYLWFGIQTVFAMTYPAFSSGILVPFMGTIELPALDLGLLLALGISLRFTHSLYGLGAVPRILDAIFVGAGLASIILYDPFVEATIAARAVVIAVSICITYQLWVITRVLVRRPPERGGAALLGVGWLTVAVGTSGDVHSWFFAAELLNGPRPTCLGLTGFALSLSLVLSRNHVRSLGRADDLNVALSRRVREVLTERARVTELNDELQAQVAARSANLFAALTLVESDDYRRRARLAPGMEIDGRYRIEAVLGRGAMGMVYEVLHLAQGSRWAMKVAAEIRGLALARLAREAHIVSQIKHPHVVQIRDIAATNLGFMYIVLELVDGQSLGERLDEGLPPLDEARRILGQVASGLAALHGAGIVHRDLKPDNVLLTEREGQLVAKITDFGISRVDDHQVRPAIATPAPNAKPRPAHEHPTRPSVVAPAPDEHADEEADPSRTVRLDVGLVPSEPALAHEDAPALPYDDAPALPYDGAPELPYDDAPALPYDGVPALPYNGAPELPYNNTPEPPYDNALPRDHGREHDDDEGTSTDERVTRTLHEQASDEGILLGGRMPSPDLALTGTGFLIGTPHYIAPEQARATGQVDTRADLFSFGVLAFEMLAGQRPFPKAVALGLLRGETVDTTPTIALPPDLGELGELVYRCLSFDPAQRPTAAQMADALADFSPAPTGADTTRRPPVRADASPGATVNGSGSALP